MAFYKKYFLLFILLIPFQNFSQNASCCTSIEATEEALSGYWKIKDVDSKSIYHYWFENGRGNVENVEVTETIGKYKPVEKSHSYIYIKKEGDTLKLEYIYKYGSWISVITLLDENNLVLVTNEEATAYYKIKY
ncbi:hypothetical protein KO494_10590 [Lacinutrix sp. C3R15]|uniref:hypothetical protein n=1 Tax=Flavobacteriaceae TaxID=49546 RepID=UPI001C093376|nr:MULTISPECIES: hypothetical protein [Flavobacteriaceae]MBU2939986.1 hypothetical protein [Lacinutrix sp. C3R15]MDO6623303.1 hypothetical protein [Oceanihabitans sp. 1_MG-2023]